MIKGLLRPPLVLAIALWVVGSPSVSPAAIDTGGPLGTGTKDAPNSQEQITNQSAKPAIDQGQSTVSITIRREDVADGWITWIGVAIAPWALVAVTIALVWVGCVQWQTYQATLDANKRAGRAYVHLSHDPTALRFEVEGFYVTMVVGQARACQCHVSVKVKNYGITPADITNVVLTLRISREPLPTVPPYDTPAEAHQFFLVAGDHFDVPGSFPISEDDARSIAAKAATVWLLGYVDYKDVFGQAHRSGYTRWT